MASSYTGNSGIEKPAEGDQTGEWGDTINTNMDIIDRSINGVGAITLSGTTHTLTTTDGTLSDGMYKVLVLGGSPSGTNTITIAPNNADKVYIVVNSSGQTATFTQGSGANVSVLNGDSKIIYADGAGSGAAIVDVTADLSFSSVNIDGGSIDGTPIGAASASTGAFTSLTVGAAAISEAELEMLDGITAGTVAASKAVVVDANKDIASFRNVTLTGELDAASLDVSGDVDVDGTLETDALSIASTAVTATAAELNYLDITTLGTSQASKAVTADASGDILIPDSDKLKFGAGSDLQIYHDGSNSRIEDSGTGSLVFTTNELSFQNPAGDEVIIGGVADGAVSLYHNNAVKLATASGGISVTGEVAATSLDVSGDADIDGTLETDALSIGSTTVTSTAAELNYNDTGAAVGTVVASKTVTVDANKDAASFRNITLTGELDAGSLDVSGDADIDGTLETDALSIAGTTVSSTAAELNYNDTGAAVGTVVASKTVTVDANKDAASFRNITLTGELDAGSLDVSGDADIDGTLEADAMTLNGTAITATATLSTGISNTNVPVFTSGVADDDFLRVAGTSIEGRSAAEVLSDIGASAVAGSGSIVTTGALNSGSITSGFGTINNGASTITTTGVVTSGSLLVADAGTIGSASDTNALAISSAGLVSLSATNAIKLNVGTTGQRPTGAAGLMRYNSTLGQFEGYGAAWGALGGGATGGGSDSVFVENGDDVTTNYTITSGKNAMSVGPITVESGVVVTIPSGSRWVVL